MGGFHIVMEGTIRDILTVLRKSGVPSEVTDDVKEKLFRLMAMSTVELDLRRLAPTASSEHVVRSIVTDVVDNVCNVKVPALQVEIAERESALLRHVVFGQRKELAEGAVVEQYAQGKVDRALEAQRYMMGTLFREVISLQGQSQQHHDTARKVQATMRWERSMRIARRSSSVLGPQVVEQLEKEGETLALDKDQSLIPFSPTTTQGEFPGLTQSVGFSGDDPLIRVASPTGSAATAGVPSSPVAAFPDDGGRGARSGSTTTSIPLLRRSSVGGTASDPSAVVPLGPTFDYSQYVDLIDKDHRMLPERCRMLEKQLEQLHETHTSEKTSLATLQRSMLKERDDVIARQQAQLNGLLREKEASTMQFNNATRVLRQQLQEELRGIAAAVAELQKVVLDNFVTIGREVEMLESAVTFFAGFVRNATAQVQRQMAKLLAGDPVRRAAVTPFWRQFLLLGNDDPDADSKAYWQGHALTRDLTSRWTSLIQDVETISREVFETKEDVKKQRRALLDARLEASHKQKQHTGLSTAAVVAHHIQSTVDPGPFRSSLVQHDLDDPLGPMHTSVNLPRDGDATEVTPDYASKPLPAGKSWVDKRGSEWKSLRSDSTPFSSQGSTSMRSPATDPLLKEEEAVTTPSGRKKRPTHGHDHVAGSGSARAPAASPGKKQPVTAETPPQRSKSGHHGGKKPTSSGLKHSPQQPPAEQSEAALRHQQQTLRKTAVVSITHIYRRIVLRARKRAFLKRLTSYAKNNIMSLQHMEMEILTASATVDKCRAKMNHIRPSPLSDGHSEASLSRTGSLVAPKKGGHTAGSPMKKMGPTPPAAMSSPSQRKESIAAAAGRQERPTLPSLTASGGSGGTSQGDSAARPTTSHSTTGRSPTPRAAVSSLYDDSTHVPQTARPMPTASTTSAPPEPEAAARQPQLFRPHQPPPLQQGPLLTDSSSPSPPSAAAGAAADPSAIVSEVRLLRDTATGNVEASLSPHRAITVSPSPHLEGTAVTAHSTTSTAPHLNSTVVNLDTVSPTSGGGGASSPRSPSSSSRLPPLFEGSSSASGTTTLLDDGRMRVAVVMPSTHGGFDGDDVESDLLRITSSSPRPPLYVPTLTNADTGTRERSQEMLMRTASRNRQINWTPSATAVVEDAD